MKKIISTLLKCGVPVALSVLLVWFFYKSMDMDAIKKSLEEDVNFWWFAPVIVVSIFSHVFRACRWRLQLRALGIEAPLRVLIDSVFGTYFLNLLVPRLGEVWRAGYVASRERTSFTKVMGSMVGDRLSDTVTVLLLTVVTFFLSHGAIMKFLNQKGAASGENMFATWWFWVLVGFFVLVVALLVWIFKTKSENKVLSKVRLMLVNLWEGLISIAKMENKWMFLLYTVLIWGCYFFQLYIASMAFSFTKDLGIVAILVLFVFSSVGMAVPTNGGVGAWQYAIMFGLAIYGVGELPLGDPYNPQASAFAWTVWLVQQVLLVVLGIYAFISMAIDRRSIKQGKTVILTKSDAEGMTL